LAIKRLATRAIGIILVVSHAVVAHEYSGPQGTVEVDWQAPNIKRIQSASYSDVFGIEASVKMGFPEPETIEGRACVSGSLFLFDVADEFAFDIDETVEIEILLDRRRSNGFWVSYDRNVLAEPLQEIAFAATDEDWLSYTVTLERARFANRGEAGSDFAIAGLSAMWPGTADENHRIVICDLQVRRSNQTPEVAAAGQLALSIQDSEGNITPSRIGIYDATGRMPLPSDDAMTIRNYDDLTRQIFLRSTHGTLTPWPHDNRHIFYTDGHYAADLPVGNYTLIASKGPEYAVVVEDFEIFDGSTSAVEILLERWTNMPAKGWYSGDDHVHMIRAESDNESISRIMQAEDVHVTNVLQMGNPAGTHFHQYAFGEDGRYGDDEFALVAGVEDPRTAVRGHTLSLNIDSVIRDPDIYLQYNHIFDAYRDQGGISGYAHVAGELFNVSRGLALDVPLGAVDFVEILQDGILSTDLWYEFLNLGFKLTPTAGSDFPYLGVPGAERNYVLLGEKFSVDRWYAQLAADRTFVSNGPMLQMQVNGQAMGSTIEVSRGDNLVISAGVSADPQGERLDRLELVVHGDVVATANNVSSDNTLQLEYTAIADGGLWLAVRAFGVDQAKAHSAPVYVEVDDTGFLKPAAVDAIIAAMLLRLDEFDTVQVDVDQELETWSVGEPLTKMFDAQRTRILQRVDEARRVYTTMLDH
jgi:hypothetical protein